FLHTISAGYRYSDSGLSQALVLHSLLLQHLPSRSDSSPYGWWGLDRLTKSLSSTVNQIYHIRHCLPHRSHNSARLYQVSVLLVVVAPLSHNSPCCLSLHVHKSPAQGSRYWYRQSHWGWGLLLPERWPG